MNQPAFPTWKRADDMAEGMTLRDYFAAAAFSSAYLYQQWLFDEEAIDTFGPDTIAEQAYAIADAMMKAREQ